MRIVGEWLMCDDGVVRPAVRIHVRDQEERAHGDDFLVDTGADRTVFACGLWRRLGVQGERPAAGAALLGVGGGVAFRTIDTTLVLTADDGRPITLRGEFAAFVDPHATDLSILGRDVLDHFDAIISRRRDEVLLLGQNHGYSVVRT